MQAGRHRVHGCVVAAGVCRLAGDMPRHLLLRVASRVVCMQVDTLATWLQGRMHWMDAALADAAAGGMGKTPNWPRTATNAPTPGQAGALGALAAGSSTVAQGLGLPVGAAQGGLFGGLLSGPTLLRAQRK